MTAEKKSTGMQFFEFTRLVVNIRWTIIKNMFMTMVIIYALSFLLPPRYSAVATLMPPQENEKLPMSSILSDISLPGLSLPSAGSSTSEMMVEILKSRSVNKNILERRFLCKKDSLPLYKFLGFSSVEKGLLKVDKYSTFIVSKQGVIAIVVRMRTARLAADVANAYIEELDRINQEKSVSRAKNSRIYIEKQLKETNEKLKLATTELANFQQINKAVSLQDQMRVSIEQVGEIKGQILAKEVELGVMKQAMKAENPLVVRAQKELDELKARYTELQYGEKGDNKNTTEFYVPFTDVPEVGLKLAELLRDVKAQETVWTLLNQQYYQSKIEEARNTPTVQALDLAEPPIVREFPPKKVLVLMAGMLSILLTIIWAVWLNYYQQLEENSMEKQRIKDLTGQFYSDWLKLKKMFSNRKSRI